MSGRYVVPAILAALATILVSLVVFEILHPCIRYRQVPATCGGECVFWLQSGDVPMCTAWAPTYACAQDVCVERKP